MNVLVTSSSRAQPDPIPRAVCCRECVLVAGLEEGYLEFMAVVERGVFASHLDELR